MPSVLFESTHPLSLGDFPIPPARIEVRNLSEYLTGMRADGDPATWYWWGMEVAERSDNQIALIGVNERLDTPFDTYNLELLSSMSDWPARRTREQQMAYEKLVDSFLTAANVWKFDTDEVDRISKACVLGSNPSESHLSCRALYFESRIKDRSTLFYRYTKLPHPELTGMGGIPNDNTGVRFMAHICYMAQVRVPSRVETFVNRGAHYVW